MIVRDKAHSYLIQVLEKASGKHFSNLIFFIAKVDVNEVDSVIEKANQLVDEVVPKTYRRAVRRALSKIRKEWWRTLESPPEWLARAAYLYLLSETLGDVARLPLVYRRLIKPEEVAKHLPLYLYYGVHTTVLLDPSKNELTHELSKEGVDIDSHVINDVIKLVLSRHAKVDTNSFTVELLGRRIYYDEESFMLLLDLLDMENALKELVSKAIKRDLLPELARQLGISESLVTITTSNVRYSYLYKRCEFDIDIPLVAVEKKYQELRNTISYVQATLRLEPSRLKVSSIEFLIKARLDGDERAFRVSYSLDDPVGLRECPRVILERLDLAIKNLLKLREEVALVRKLAEQSGLGNVAVDYAINDQYTGSGKVALNSSIEGELHGTFVKTRYEVTIENGEVRDRRVSSNVYVSIDKRVANAVAADALRSYLVGEGLDVAEISVSARKGYLVVALKHSDINNIFQDLSKSVKTIDEYLSRVKEDVSVLPPLKDEHAVAIYIYAKAMSESGAQYAFGRTFSEVAMRLGRLLSTINPPRYSSIKSTLESMKQRGEEANLLVLFEDVVKALVESGYLRIDRDGNLVINGARFTDLLSECSKKLLPSTIERVEQEALAKVIWATNADIVDGVVQETGRLPDKILVALEDAYLPFNPMFLVTKRVAGKPLIAYTSGEFIKKVATHLFARDVIQVLTNPEYEQYFSEVRDELLKKVFYGPPGIVTRYAFVKMPELFANVPVREVDGDEFDYMLEHGKWFCQVGYIGRDKHVFIMYRKDVGVGVAVVARNLHEALSKVAQQYEDGVRVANLLMSSASMLRNLGLTLEVYKSHRHGTLLLFLVKSQGERRYYYITPAGGNRLLDMLKEQETEVVVDA